MVDTVIIFIIEHKVQYYCLCPVNPLSLFQYLLHVCTLKHYQSYPTPPSPLLTTVLPDFLSNICNSGPTPHPADHFLLFHVPLAFKI